MKPNQLKLDSLSLSIISPPHRESSAVEIVSIDKKNQHNIAEVFFDPNGEIRVELQCNSEHLYDIDFDFFVNKLEEAKLILINRIVKP